MIEQEKKKASNQESTQKLNRLPQEIGIKFEVIDSAIVTHPRRCQIFESATCNTRHFLSHVTAKDATRFTLP